MTARSPLGCDVCVIGAGPAGSTIARRLAALGHDVVVVEAALFPRRQIGESLPPSIRHVLDLCGVRRQIENAGFLRADSAIVQWSTPEAECRRFGEAPGFQVDRGRFDQLLLQAARDAGARIWQPARAGRPARTADGWSIPVEHSGASQALEAQFLVDAAGKHAGLSRHRLRTSAPSVAMYGYWSGAGIEGTETRVEAGRRAWYWGAPLPDGSFNAVVFVDAEECAGQGRQRLAARYRSLLGASRLLGGCTRGRLRDPVRTCDASSYVDRDPVTLTSVKVGDAAFSIDPLSSQGVQAAMMSAFQAGTVVNTILRRPGDADIAMEFYRTRQREVVDRHRRIAGALYAEHVIYRDEPFWRQRARTAAPQAAVAPVTTRLDPASSLEISATARIVSVPTIDGDFIRRTDAVDHESLERPVAFLGGAAVAPLLRQLGSGRSAARLVEQWSRALTGSHARDILRWLWGRGIVVPARDVSPGIEGNGCH
jgi:flavin-dependent dehydrogenase